MATRKPKSKDTEPPIQLLITSKCASISGRGGEVRYAIGILDDTNIYIKIVSSSGGQINNSWIPFADVLKLLESHSGGSAFSSAVFDPIYSDCSRNNRGFTLAVALKEKLVVPQEGKRRKFVYNSPAPFLAKVDKLKATMKPAASSKKSPSRRKAKS